jgi:hypothetical protein
MVDLPVQAITLKPCTAAISGDVGHAGRLNPEDFGFSIGLLVDRVILPSQVDLVPTRVL